MSHRSPSASREFAREYIRNGFNGKNAVLAVGYKQTDKAAIVTACRLLQKPEVKRIVENHLKKSAASASEVLERLTDISRRDAKFSGSDVVKATELLGKGHRLFVDKVESENKTTITTDGDQFAALLRRLRPDLSDSDIAQLRNESLGNIEGEAKLIG